MNALALDTSTRDLSLALIKAGKIVKYKNAIKSKDLARQLPQLVEKFLKGTGVPLKRIDAVAIGLGPGSFTGLRVGVAAVQALSFGLGVAVYGVSSLDAIAYHVRKKSKKICVLVDARRNLFYGGLYDADGKRVKRTSDLLLSPLADILKACDPHTLLVGDGCGLIDKSVIGSKKFVVAATGVWKPQARDLWPLLEEKINKGQSDGAEGLVPIYLYPEDCQAVGMKA